MRSPRLTRFSSNTKNLITWLIRTSVISNQLLGWTNKHRATLEGVVVHTQAAHYDIVAAAAANRLAVDSH